MAEAFDDVYRSALGLSDESKERLVERLVEHIESRIDPALQRAHLDTVRKRREEIRMGRVKAIDGEEALAKARRMLDR
ncbi:MAG TPA: acyl-protein synthetase [Planctomycetes bacterium]|jgi:hypothetical protein|nr:acyl-protein synthetase [Planctomycetota bacterium]